MEMQFSLHFSQEHIAVSAVSEINPVHDIPPSLFKIQFNIIPHLGLDLQSGLFPYVSPLKSCMHLLLLSKGHVPINLILINFTTRILLCSVYKARSPSLLSLLLPTPRNRVLPQLVNNSPHCMDTKSSLLHPQELVPCPESL